MKSIFLFTVLLLNAATSLAAETDVLSASQARGRATVTVLEASEKEATIAIGGSAAKAIWIGMSEIPLNPAGPMILNDTKLGKNVRCERVIRNDIVGMKKGDVVCYLQLTDRATGAL